ncbi:MAG: hypothetical protein A2977_00500 [Alphaproteobacteria bacterium RIFCSPLOWO2_01_FULL_45_8]|nr:MAG: hypothetical protein A2065_00520 [Alphaproteobacteria bacterium GWB1_45_5]OFW76567.1 MAG: hypothetical protein A3K20_00065 [Alphaproteobacteria bacterium GWA1_45_9]OFW89651.1 MAG: hypothetical protein A2621_01955 [Alphaproteobacteria bacterium RIFCSPHIGHO2_01_FULL_41_14]OFW96568.1 MAG: hypothetical protein A2977_00500 [Alphaproteobacteria bacterium RIFCSPLOWO2_01_FULL_45_8]HCI49091.1 hypothetical protein [Holosporales bacterium]
MKYILVLVGLFFLNTALSPLAVAAEDDPMMESDNDDGREDTNSDTEDPNEEGVGSDATVGDE